MELPPSTAAAARAGINIQVAHSHGLTRVEYAPSGSKVSWLFTGGDEGTVRLLPTDPSSGAEALAIDDATAPINWIDADADYLVAAAADGAVRIYQHNASLSEDGAAATDLVGILTRTGLPARCAALERHVLPTKTPRVACLSDDLVIKVVDSGAPQRVQLLAKHSRPPKAAAWSPVEPLLITTDCDGVACIWDMQGTEPVHVKAIERVLAQARPESEYSSEPVWHPSGNSFVLPSKTHEVVMVEKPSWNVSTSFSAPARDQLPPGVESPSGQISALSFSPNGRYLAVATASAHVTIWDTATRKPLRQRSAYSLVTGISWHPEADALAWTDAQGQLSRWWEVVGSANANPFELLDYQHRSTEQTLKERVRQQQVTEDIDALFDGAGLSDEDEETEAMLDKDERRPRTRERQMRAGGEVDDDLNDFVVDDDGGGTGYGAATDRRSRTQKTTGLTQRHVGRSHSSLSSSTKMQSAFQPTSTDLRGQRRYFAYSCLGSLVGTDQGDHQTIAFESSDAGSRRNWRFADHFGYNMASLGGSGALFACPERHAKHNDDHEDEDDAESGHPSSIFFKPFEASGARTTLATEWTVNLPRGEEAVAIAMAGKAPRSNADSTAADAMTISSAIVATSAGYLRFFSASGFQRYLWALGSPVVSMAAGTHSAMIVHRGATSCALEGFQNLSYILIDLLTFSIQQQGVLPLAKDATLRWVGLNDADVPAFFDSRGVLYLLDRSHAPHGQARWVPCLDTKNIQAQQASKTDSSLAPRLHYWPVGLTSHKLLAIILKGAHSTPDPSASSRPLLQDLDLHFPLAAGEGPAAALEQEHARSAFLADSIRSARRARALDLELDGDEEPDDDDSPDPWALQHNADKALLQLIQLACKADRHARALDAAMELHSEKTLDAALQIATFFHQPGLADRMENLRGWVRGRRERDERRGSASVVLAPQPPTALQCGNGLHGINKVDDTVTSKALTAKAARKALTTSWTPQTRRSHGGSDRGAGVLSTSAAIASSPIAVDSQARSTAVAWPESSRSEEVVNAENGMIERGDCDSMLDKENLFHDVEDVELHQRPDKRKAIASHDVEKGDAPPSRSKLNSGNPFVRAATRNPFARNPGMTRDRSMHKSSSFFDRVDASLDAQHDAALPVSRLISSDRRSGSGSSKSRQSTLFGLGAPKASGPGTKPVASKEAPTLTPNFGQHASSGNEDSQATDESLARTLATFNDEDSQNHHLPSLEETQYPDPDADEETQLVDASGRQSDAGHRRAAEAPDGEDDSNMMTLDEAHRAQASAHIVSPV